MSINLFSQGNPFSRIPCNSSNYTKIFHAKQSLFEKNLACYVSSEEYDIDLNEALKIHKNNNGKNMTKTLLEKGIKVRSNLVIDIDGIPNRDEYTLENVIKLTTFLIEKMQMKDGIDFFIHFSGRKGFHLIIPNTRFGAEFIEPIPGTSSNLITFSMASELVKESGMDISLFDRTTQYQDKIMRVACSKHDKTDTYCLPFSFEELVKLNWKSIKESATIGNAKYKDTPQLLTEPHSMLAELYQKHFNLYIKKSKPFKLPLTVKSDGFLCKCVEFYVNHCKMLLPNDYNRFADNMPFAIAAYKSGGEAELKKFHEAFARNMGAENSENKAENWTTEIINTIKNKHHACISGYHNQDSYILGTKSKIERLISVSNQKFNFQCSNECPLKLVIKGQQFGEFINRIASDCGTDIKELFVSAVFDYFIENGYENQLMKKLE
ncbi:MAG: hypothetical protein QMC67_13690 [Candidatus Wallbacteria bacterium]